MLSDHSFNCQMGRGRTTTGMVAASMIATVASEDTERLLEQADGEAEHESGEMAESKQYLNGEWRGLCVMLRGFRESKPLCESRSFTGAPINSDHIGRTCDDTTGEYRTILQLVSVLSHGKGEWRTEWQTWDFALTLRRGQTHHGQGH